MEFEKKRMVNWYNVRQLASTGLKTAISGVFGNFADKREMEAALSPDAGEYDAFEKNDEVWVDYVSDLGDGFNSTYSVAYSLAQEKLIIDGKVLKQGDVLIMGGDAVYPTPEAAQYENRLQGPYNAAFPWIPNPPTLPPCAPNPYTRKLFVLPGNHDWYDGLGNFIKLFCQKRSLGRWLTEQERSYFAVKLPHNYWLIGIDIQLNADIDKPQMDYFRNILAKGKFEAGSNVILCTAEPSWVYRSWDEKNKSHARIQFFIDKVLYGDECCSYYEKNKSLRIAAILTGDLHHYSRYAQDLGEGEDRRVTQLITAGGGGAFTHPTHFLKEDMTLGTLGKTGWAGRASAALKASYPTPSQSKGLAWWNLLFPVLSLHMLLFLGVFHLFTTWCLQSGGWNDETFLDQVASVKDSGEYLSMICRNIKFSPGVVILNVLLVFGLYKFADVTAGTKWLNSLVGFFHGVVQLLIFYFIIWGFVVVNTKMLHALEVTPECRSFWQITLFSVEMVVIGGAVAALAFGLYLLFGTLVLKNHATEAFSSFRWTGYKNFLRIHITPSKATVYAVGIRKVATQWAEQTTDKYASRFKPKTDIQYTLIDEIELKP
jgi:hypothetical protein